MNLFSKAQRIGVAIGPERATAVLLGTRVSASVDCTLGADSDVAALASVLDSLKSALSSAAGQMLGKAKIDVALMPPFSEVRLVPLPPLRPNEALAVLKRDAARHFVGAAHNHRAVAVQLPQRSGTAPQPALAAAASAPFIELIYSAAAAAGWQVRRVVPALAAWSAATDRSKGAPRVLAAQCSDVIHVLRINAAPMQLRRVPVTALSEVQDGAGTGPGNAWVWATGEIKPELEAVLAAKGWKLQATTQADAYLIAAQFAGNAPLELLPDSRALLRAAQQRTLAQRIAVAAVLLLVGAAGAELWGAQRQLNDIRAQRAAIREEVTPLLALRDSANRVSDRIKRIDGLRAGSSHLTAALIDMATLLPSNTYVTAIRATGDSLVVEAAGAQAGAALEALRASEVLHDIRQRGTVDRRMEEGAVTTERFTFTARVVTRGQAPAPAPAPVKSVKSAKQGAL